MVKIKLVDDQIDRIIIDELKNDYHVITREIDPSQRLLDAIKCVLRYYMNSEEYDRPFTIEVTWDQLNWTIIEELKVVYEANYKPESCGIYGMSQPDTELASSVDQLLQYYMSEPDYKRWKESLND